MTERPDNVLEFTARTTERRTTVPALPSRTQLLRQALDHVERATVGATLALHVAPGDPLEEAVQLLARARNIMVSANPTWQPEAEQARVAESRVGDSAVVDQSRAPDPPTHTGQGPSGSTNGDAA